MPLRFVKKAIAFHAPICDRPFSSFFAPTLRERFRRMRETKKRSPALMSRVRSLNSTK
ncbi:MAG: hypothetical protein RMY34_04100 [Aulosira sp. DedQUE10]|nr:hypothetical protein [Aulosira sp. DedQUE10]